MSVAVINTHDNPEYVPPSQAEGVVIDSKIRLGAGSARHEGTPKTTAIAQTIYQLKINSLQNPQDVLHGGTTNHFHRHFHLFLPRWGSDTENKNYYEIRFPVSKGWDPDNNIEPNSNFSQLKVQPRSNVHSDTMIISNNQQIILVGNCHHGPLAHRARGNRSVRRADSADESGCPTRRSAAMRAGPISSFRFLRQR
jgi:hypothetical protein